MAFGSPDSVVEQLLILLLPLLLDNESIEVQIGDVGVDISHLGLEANELIISVLDCLVKLHLEVPTILVIGVCVIDHVEEC